MGKVEQSAARRPSERKPSFARRKSGGKVKGWSSLVKAHSKLKAAKSGDRRDSDVQAIKNDDEWSSGKHSDRSGNQLPSPAVVKNEKVPSEPSYIEFISEDPAISPTQAVTKDVVKAKQGTIKRDSKVPSEPSYIEFINEDPIISLTQAVNKNIVKAKQSTIKHNSVTSAVPQEQPIRRSSTVRRDSGLVVPSETELPIRRSSTVKRDSKVGPMPEAIVEERRKLMASAFEKSASHGDARKLSMGSKDGAAAAWAQGMRKASLASGKRRKSDRLAEVANQLLSLEVDAQTDLNPDPLAKHTAKKKTYGQYAEFENQEPPQIKCFRYYECCNVKNGLQTGLAIIAVISLINVVAAGFGFQYASIYASTGLTFIIFVVLGIIAILNILNLAFAKDPFRIYLASLAGVFIIFCTLLIFIELIIVSVRLGQRFKNHQLFELDSETKGRLRVRVAIDVVELVLLGWFIGYYILYLLHIRAKWINEQVRQQREERKAGLGF